MNQIIVYQADDLCKYEQDTQPESAPQYDMQRSMIVFFFNSLMPIFIHGIFITW